MTKTQNNIAVEQWLHSSDKKISGTNNSRQGKPKQTKALSMSERAYAYKCRVLSGALFSTFFSQWREKGRDK